MRDDFFRGGGVENFVWSLECVSVRVSCVDVCSCALTRWQIFFF